MKIDGVIIELNSDYECELRKEILEHVGFMLSSFRGTIPMNREIGIDPDTASAISFEARAKYTVGAMEMIDKFEDRATVESVDFVEEEGTGKFIPKVVLRYDGE